MRFGLFPISKRSGRGKLRAHLAQPLQRQLTFGTEMKGWEYESSDSSCWMVHSVRAVLASGTACSDSLSRCLAFVFTVAAYRCGRSMRCLSLVGLIGAFPKRPAHAVPERLHIGIVNCRLRNCFVINPKRLLEPFLCFIQLSKSRAIARDDVRDQPHFLNFSTASSGFSSAACVRPSSWMQSGHNHRLEKNAPLS